MTQSDEKKTVREALERGLDKERQKKYSDAMECMTTHRWYWQWAQDLESNCKEALAALSAIDTEAIKREKDSEIASLKVERDRLRGLLVEASEMVRYTPRTEYGQVLLHGWRRRTNSALASSPAEAKLECWPELEDYVAWLRYVPVDNDLVAIETCSSTDTGAFKVYRRIEAAR